LDGAHAQDELSCCGAVGAMLDKIVFDGAHRRKMNEN
jgi:hypothetical protein